MKKMAFLFLLISTICTAPFYSMANDENIEVITIIHNPTSDYTLVTLNHEVMASLRTQLQQEIANFTRTQTTHMASSYLEHIYIQSLVNRYGKSNG